MRNVMVAVGRLIGFYGLLFLGGVSTGGAAIWAFLLWILLGGFRVENDPDNRPFRLAPGPTAKQIKKQNEAALKLNKDWQRNQANRVRTLKEEILDQ
jgi:hypothetical protein